MCYRLGPKFFIQKDSRPFRFKGREPVSPVLPPYFTAVSRQLPLSVSKTSEYPDAVTFVSYVAAYSPSEDSCFGCAAQGGIQAEVLRAPLILRLLSVRLSLSSTCSRQSLSGMLDLYKSGFIISAGKIFVKPRLSILLQNISPGYPSSSRKKISST